MSLEVKKIDDGIFQLLDGTIVFSPEKSVAEYSKIQSLDFTVGDLILMLLYSQPDKSVRDRIALFKEIFVIEREIFGKRLLRWNEVPGRDEHLLRKFIATMLNNWSLGDAEVEKSNNQRVIKVPIKDDIISITMDQFKTKAVMNYSKAKETWNPFHTFFVRVKGDDYEVLLRTV
jgi:hypothetical protein